MSGCFIHLIICMNVCVYVCVRERERESINIYLLDSLNLICQITIIYKKSDILIFQNLPLVKDSFHL